MRHVGAAEIDRSLSFPRLIAALRTAFGAEIAVPTRHHHTIDLGGSEATHLLMPAWIGGDHPFLGVKVVNVFPGNAGRGLPSVSGLYVLMSGETGAPLMTLDGTRLTLWRTAAASALASAYLSQADASHHLMIGAGALAPFLVRAHASVRPIARVTLWARRRAQAEAVAAGLPDLAPSITVTDDLSAAIAEADIISSATLSTTPLIEGERLKPGAHLDLVGAFRPEMRESDDACIARARLFCDTRAGALTEGGDLVQPIRSGLIEPEQVEADLLELCRQSVHVSRNPADVTLFKSVGTALEDLAAAMLVHQSLEGAQCD